MTQPTTKSKVDAVNCLSADLLLLETKKLTANVAQSKADITTTLGDPLSLIKAEVQDEEKYLQFIKTDNDYVEKREVFINKLGGVKQGPRKKGDRDECDELQQEFLELGKEYRYDKEIIRKIFSMQYYCYQRSDNIGVRTYYDSRDVASKLPDILYHDKEFVLELITTLGLEKIIGIIKKKYGESYSLWKDKDFIIQILNRNDGYKVIDLNLLEHVVQDEDIIALYYSQKGGYDWHEQPEKYRDNKKFLLAVFKKKGLDGFYTFSNNSKIREYYTNLKKNIQDILINDEVEIIKIIENDVLSLKDTNIKKFIPKINQELLKDDTFICKLLRSDPELVTFCGERGAHILKFIKLIKANGSDINWNSIDFGDHGTISYIQGTSRYSGSGGSEYGNYIAVYYQGSIEKKHFVYRDAYNPAKDDRSYNLGKTKITNIHENEGKVYVNVEGSSDKRTVPVTFNFAVAHNTNTEKNGVEEDKFLQMVTETKAKIIQAETGKYDGCTMSPCIKSENINAAKGVAIVVLYKQIDYSNVPSMGHQYAYEAFKINSDGSYFRIAYNAARQYAIQAGNTIMIDAQDYTL